MKMNDVCPNCGKRLRWYPPDIFGIGCGAWKCTKCGYKRNEGSATNPWKGFRRHKK